MLTSILLAAIFLFILWKFVQNDKDPLDDLPGPRKVPFLGHSYIFIGKKPRDLFLLMKEFKKKYGDRFVIKVLSRKILHISSPDDIETVLTSTKNITKSYPYSLLHPWLGTGLLLSTGAKWHRRRKILTPTFHFNILRSFLRITEEKSSELVNRLKTLDGQEADVMALVSDFTLHTICETAMGTRLDSQSPTAMAYKSSIFNLTALSLKRLVKFWLHNDIIFSWTEMGRSFREELDKAHKFTDSVILERKKERAQPMPTDEESPEMGGKRRLAMMDLLLDAEDKGHIDLEGIREEVNTFMFEGHDTTAMAISFGLMLLAEHENVQTKIFEECQRIFGGSDRAPEMADLAEMKYLEATIKEILRMYPSVPSVGRTVTEDFMMGDMLVKRGSEIVVNIYTMHQSPDLYPEPDKFKPERFLDWKPTHPYAYVPFSAGPRNCIGQRFAMQEMKCVLSSVCRWCRLAPPARGARPSLVADFILRPIEPIRVTFMKR